MSRPTPSGRTRIERVSRRLAEQPQETIRFWYISSPEGRRRWHVTFNGYQNRVLSTAALERVLDDLEAGRIPTVLS